MRTIRALTIAAAIVVALPTIAAAQARAPVQGRVVLGSQGRRSHLRRQRRSPIEQAPLAGIDWLITRTHGGLYVSGGQAFFTSKTLTLPRSELAGRQRASCDSISRTCVGSTSP